MIDGFLIHQAVDLALSIYKSFGSEHQSKTTLKLIGKQAEFLKKFGYKTAERQGPTISCSLPEAGRKVMALAVLDTWVTNSWRPGLGRTALPLQMPTGWAEVPQRRTLPRTGSGTGAERTLILWRKKSTADLGICPQITNPIVTLPEGQRSCLGKIVFHGGELFLIKHPPTPQLGCSIVWSPL